MVTLSHEAWCAFVWELRSSFALLYADEVATSQGSFGQLARWEPSLRVAFSGQDLYDLDDPPLLRDTNGSPLDLTRSFTLDDPGDEIGAFLHEAGFVHLRGVMEATEVEALRQDVDTAVADARPDDRRSWWTTVDGRDVCNRVNYLNYRSERVAGSGPTNASCASPHLGGDDLRDAYDRLDGNSVVIKVPGRHRGPGRPPLAP